MFEIEVPGMKIELSDENYGTLEELAAATGNTPIEYAQLMIANKVVCDLNAQLAVYRMNNPGPDPQRN